MSIASTLLESLKKETKVLTEDTGNPAVYVGTYSKYNSGSIKGKWMDLTEYADYDDFYAAAKELHKDEGDPELMFQDFEHFPRYYYHESSLNPDLWDWMELKDDEKDIISAYSQSGNSEEGEDLRSIIDRFDGKYDSKADWAMNYMDSIGSLKDSLGDNASNYLTISDTDVRVLAGDLADSYVTDLDDDRAVEEADLQDEYDAAESDADKEKVVSKAKDIVLDKYIDNVTDSLNEDPVGYLTNELGYDLSGLEKLMSVDYEQFARDCESEGSVDFQKHEGEIYAFQTR